MFNKEFLTVDCSKNKVDRVRQLTQILCILEFQDVTGRELDLLCEFIYHDGVNDKAKKSFMANYKTSAANYGQVVKRLSDKKILVEKEVDAGRNTHQIGKILHKSFEDLKRIYINKTEDNILAVVVRK